VQESSSEALLGQVSRLEAEVSALRTAETETEADVRTLKMDSRAQSDVIATLERLQLDVRTLKEYTGALPSLIVWDFPEVFAEFRGKRFSLLWLGSRDDFGARDFHSPCDLHANTLTLILDTKGNIFGAFSPVQKNPHSVPARRFALRSTVL
jgi:hypothetical protein